MRIDLTKLSNSEIVGYVNDQITQYEAEKEQSKLTGNPIYNGVPLADFQQFDKQLQRCLMFQTPGANETAAKVKQILQADARISCKDKNPVTSLHDYYQKTGQVHKFFENGKR